MEKVSCKELTIGFLVLIAFFVSVAVGYLSHQNENIEDRVSHIEKTVNVK